MSHCAEKCKRDPFGFINIHSVAKFQKLEGGPFRGIKHFRKKAARCRKNIKGGLFSPVRLCRFP